jgi:hypothetical protein
VHSWDSGAAKWLLQYRFRSGSQNPDSFWIWLNTDYAFRRKKERGKQRMIANIRPDIYKTPSLKPLCDNI